MSPGAGLDGRQRVSMRMGVFQIPSPDGEASMRAIQNNVRVLLLGGWVQ